MVFNNNNNNDDEEIDDNAINVATITTDDDNIDNDQNCHTRTAEEISNQVATIVAAVNSTNSADLSFSATTVHQINTSASNITVPSTVAETVTTMSRATKTANSTRKMFECDVCNMRFSNGANMRRHRMRHSGVKPYECRICQKRFFRKDHLAEHFTTHTKTLPYHCPICDRGFQRQIAMRAHFQNEHVGQHELVKSCPLCNYHASSMKSLRVHFYNRHGVDLDNPGPSSTILVSTKHLTTSSIIDSLMNENSNSSNSNLNMSLNGNSNCTNYHFTNNNDNVNNNSIINGNTLSVTLTSSVNDTRTFSDSGDSTGARSVDNLTPPMHFLTPQVEISMASDHDSNLHFDHDKEQRTKNNSGVSKTEYMTTNTLRSPPYLQPIMHDMENNNTGTNSNSMNNNTNIIPSISLIPIKQEIIHSDDSYYESNTYPITSSSSSSSSSSLNNNTNSITTTVTTMTPSNGPLSSSIKKTSCAAVSISPLNPITSIANNSLSSLIKVSPLKSLLRDEIKRKTCSSVTSTATTITTINNALSSNNRTANMYSGGGAIGQLNSQTMIVWPNFTKNASQLEQTQQLISDMKCIFCGICFPDQTLYFLHIGCHSDSNPWKCNICGEQCSNIYEFNSHLLSKSH